MPEPNTTDMPEWVQWAFDNSLIHNRDYGWTIDSAGEIYRLDEGDWIVYPALGHIYHMNEYSFRRIYGDN